MKNFMRAVNFGMQLVIFKNVYEINEKLSKIIK